MIFYGCCDHCCLDGEDVCDEAPHQEPCIHARDYCAGGRPVERA